MQREDKTQLSKKSIFALLLSKKTVNFVFEILKYHRFLGGIRLVRFKTKYETRDARVGLRLLFYKNNSMHPANRALGISLNRVKITQFYPLQLNITNEKNLCIMLILITNSLRTPTFLKLFFRQCNSLNAL